MAMGGGDIHRRGVQDVPGDVLVGDLLAIRVVLLEHQRVGDDHPLLQPANDELRSLRSGIAIFKKRPLPRAPIAGLANMAIGDPCWFCP